MAHRARIMRHAFWLATTMLVRGPMVTVSGRVAQEEERLIGWLGEVPEPVSEHNPDKDPWIEQLSWSPRAYLWHNMLTPEQCQRMIDIAKTRVSKSKVVDSKTGGEADDPIRTSYGGVVYPEDDQELVDDIDEKCAKWAMLPVQNSEQIQVLRYQDGQKYDAHWDQFDNPVMHKAFFDNGGQRVATVLIYLSDVEEGGETVFPNSQAWVHPERAETARGFSSCGKRGVAVKPSVGDALLFHGVELDGHTIDKASMHAGCPVLRGTKWTATKWMHAEKYNTGSPEKLLKPGECRDLNAGCLGWAKGGECKNNPNYMLGSPGAEPQCAKACKVCEYMSKNNVVDRTQVPWLQ